MKRLATAALIAALFSPAAFADTLTLNSFAFGSSTSTPLKFKLTAFDVNTNAYASATDMAGELKVAVVSGSSGTAQSYLSYCIDLFQNISFGSSYSNFSLVSAGANPGNTQLAWFTTSKATDLSRLFTEAASQVVDTTTSAAFQLAVWAIEYETGSYSMGKLMTGTSAFATAADATTSSAYAAEATALTQANTWLAGLPGYASAYDIKIEYSATIQDQVIAKKLPEPSGFALGGTALGLLALSRRRNANARTALSFS